jgi:hypothetical protein
MRCRSSSALRFPSSSSRRKPGSSAFACDKAKALDSGFRRNDGVGRTGATGQSRRQQGSEIGGISALRCRSSSALRFPSSSSRRKPGSSAYACDKAKALDSGFRRNDGVGRTGATGQSCLQQGTEVGGIAASRCRSSSALRFPSSSSRRKPGSSAYACDKAKALDSGFRRNDGVGRTGAAGQSRRQQGSEIEGIAAMRCRSSSAWRFPSSSSRRKPGSSAYVCDKAKALDSGFRRNDGVGRTGATGQSRLQQGSEIGGMTAMRCRSGSALRFPSSSSRRKPGSSAYACDKAKALDSGFRRNDGVGRTGVTGQSRLQQGSEIHDPR